MYFHKNLITITIFSVVSPSIFAEESNVKQLETIQLQAHPLVQTAADFAVADHIIDQKQLAGRATTIGGGNVLIRVYNSMPDESIDKDSEVTVSTDGQKRKVPAGIYDSIY